MSLPTTCIRRSVSIVRTNIQRERIYPSHKRFLSCDPEKYLFIQQQPFLYPLPAMTSPEITDIEELHRQSILQKQSTYTDPSTGFTVFNELAHLKRGRCCGNMCRHCPYGYSNVRGVDPSAHGIAKSGDREGTGVLVEKIMNGTYYDECCYSHLQSVGDADLDGTRQPESCKSTESDIRGKGGNTGGTLTSKNVPYTRKGDSGTSQLFTGERRS